MSISKTSPAALSGKATDGRKGAAHSGQRGQAAGATSDKGCARKSLWVRDQLLYPHQAI